MRSLTLEEAELWAKVAATIRPLSRERIDSPQSHAAEQKREVDRQPTVLKSGPRTKSAARQQNLAVATLDSGWDRRLRSGLVEPDRVLDLHGRTLDQAWHAIDEALERGTAAGERVILLITGHARPGVGPVARGKIRAVVFDWLTSSPHARNIAAVRPAHRRHGGAGSLYIILRRAKANSTFS